MADRHDSERLRGFCNRRQTDIWDSRVAFGTEKENVYFVVMKKLLPPGQGWLEDLNKKEFGGQIFSVIDT